MGTRTNKLYYELWPLITWKNILKFILLFHDPI
jgi:hypothetical protein